MSCVPTSAHISLPHIEDRWQGKQKDKPQPIDNRNNCLELGTKRSRDTYGERQTASENPNYDEGGLHSSVRHNLDGRAQEHLDTH